MKPYVKAAFAFLIAFLSGLSGGLSIDGSLTLGTWISAALAGVIAAGGVYQIPYAPKLKPAPAVAEPVTIKGTDETYTPDPDHTPDHQA